MHGLYETTYMKYTENIGYGDRKHMNSCLVFGLIPDNNCEQIWGNFWNVLKLYCTNVCKL